MATHADIKLEFVRLSDIPELVDACASFHASQTGCGEDADGFDQRKAAFQRLALDGEEEDAVLGLFSEGDREGEIAAMAVLVSTELEAFDDLGPWMSGVLVSPCCEQGEVLKRLSAEVEELADEMGYAHLFVHSTDLETYDALNYAKIEPFRRDDKEHWVLGKAL